MTQHIQQGNSTGIIFSILLSVSVIIIMIFQVSLSNIDILSHITDFVKENKTISNLQPDPSKISVILVGDMGN